MGWRTVLCVLAGLLASSSASPAGTRFEPQSVTFVSTRHGWVLGTSPCGAHRCLALRETTDGGRAWSAAPLPAALVAAADRRFSGAAADYAVTSLNVRFADARDGWIYGGVPIAHPQSGSTYYSLRAVLWSTHDGGADWKAVPLHGLGLRDTIFDLEAARGTAWLMESGTREDLTVKRSAVGGDDWTVARTPPLGTPAGGTQQTGGFVLADGAGWLVEGNDRGVTGSARLVGGRWVRWTPPCAAVGGSFSIPAASSARDLVAVCVMGGYALGLSPSAPPGATLGSSWLYLSTDGGARFHAGPELAAKDIADPAALGGPIASPAPGTILLGRSDPDSGAQSLIATFDGGLHWGVIAEGAPVFLGFTSPDQGVAIVRAANGTTAMLMSFDSGRHWARVRF